MDLLKANITYDIRLLGIDCAGHYWRMLLPHGSILGQSKGLWAEFGAFKVTRLVRG